ncbi:MAG: methylamine dehydrogenase light chain [Pseudohongiellaceae bacterium]
MNPQRIIDSSCYWIDAQARRTTLALARKLSRRNFLSRLGVMLAGVASLPLLPVARSFAQNSVQEMGDPQSCDYWRYCAMSGTLCACCGGSSSSCPPGAQPSPITWVGTCRNPVDGRDYLMSYNDCCGKAVCARCGCHNTEGDKPVYFSSNSNSVLWCFGVEDTSYHCTVSAVVGLANE